MNSLVIPPPPNWYESSILACAPDNTLIYGSRNDIVVIQDVPNDQPANVRIIPRAHSQKIICTSINRNWGQPNKLLVTVSEDKIIKLWNIELMERKLAHNEHANHGKVIGAAFAGDEKVISVSEEGVIIIWNISVNQTNILKDLFGFKVTVTCISTCPHATWLTAFGLKSGLVVITDLRKEGKVLYKLRGHDKAVLSLAWCPAPVNIFPKDPNNYVGTKERQILRSKQSENENDANESKITKSESAGENKHKSSSKQNIYKKNLWTDLKHADDDDDLIQDCIKQDETHPLLKVYDNDDFLKECETLKNRILETGSSDTDITGIFTIERKVSKGKKCSEDYETKQKQENRLENKDLETPGKKTDTTKECEGNISKTEIHEEVISLCKYKDNLKKADFEVRDKTLTEIKSEDTDNKIINTEVTEDKKVIPSEAVVVACVTKDESDVIVDESVKKECCSENKNETVSDGVKELTIIVPAASSDQSVCIQDKSVKEVPSTKDKNEEIDTSIISSIGSTCDAEDKSNIALTGHDSEEVSGESKEIKPMKISDNESDGSKDQSFTEDVESILITSIAAVAENEFNNNKEGKVTAGNLNEADGEVREEFARVPIDEEPRKEFLLASSGREGNIYIWRAGTDGRMQTFLTTPNKSTHRKFGRQSPEKIWIVLCWVTPNILLSSSKSAELIRWNLPKPRDTSKQSVVIHNDHNSILFSIAAPIIRLDKSNWLDEVINGKKRQLNAWTVGHDRLLLCTSLEKERKNLACYPTVGRAECFAASPIDSNRLAIGTGEGVIKLWDVSRPHIKNITMTNFYQKIQSKVVTLAWHPHKEMVLAYGTSEGRIGYMDTGKKKPPTLLPNFFKSQIHKIEWGPMNGNMENIGLFVVAEGKLVVFNTKPHEKEPQEVDTPDNTYVYTFAWKPNYEVLLVTTKAGALITYSMDLKILSTQYLQHKLQHIYWHSTATSSDLELSKYCYYFAAISNLKELMVYNSAIKSDISEERVVSKYKSGGDVINCAAWNPHSQPELVIARDDGIAQIWNIDSNTIVSTYINPSFDSLSAVIWSPLDEQFLISSSKDHTLKVWNKSDFPAKSDQEVSDIRKAALKKLTSEASDLLLKVEKTQEEPTKVKKSNKNNLLPNFYPVRNTSQIIPDLRKLLLWKEGEDRALLEERQGETSILNVFDSSEHMLKLIELNESDHKQKGKYHLDTTLSLFKGDISTSVKAAIDEKRVTPWVIMMAPMVSHKVWYTACEVYAQQLSVEQDSDPLELATLYLMCHKVEEAINTLCDGTLYREALALAKCRLAPDDPTITDVIEKWGRNSQNVGNFEVAAQCYIVLGKYAEAASVLFRRSDAETLKFAAELAEKSGNEELHQAVVFRYKAFAEENKISENETKLPTKAEAILQKDQTEGDDKVRLLQKPDGDEIEKSQEVNDSGQDVVPAKDEAVLQIEQANGEGKVGLLQKPNKDKEAESHVLQELNGTVPTKDEKVKLLELFGDEEAETHVKAEAGPQKEQVEDDKIQLLQKSDGDKGVENHALQELNGSVPTKDVKAKLVQLFGDEETESHVKAESGKEQVEDDKIQLLQKSDGDKGVENHSLQELNGTVPTKDVKAKLVQLFGDEEIESHVKAESEKEQVEDDKVQSLQKSDQDKGIESRALQELNGSAPNKDERVRLVQLCGDAEIESDVKSESHKEQVDDGKVQLLQKSDGDKEIQTPALQELNGSVPTKDEKVRLSMLEILGDEKLVNGSEQNSTSDPNQEKKSFSDESMETIEDSVQNERVEMALSDMNTESLASAAESSEEKCGGNETAVGRPNEGLLTTEEVRKLLSNSKLEFFNDSDVESADTNKNSKDRCY